LNSALTPTQQKRSSNGSKGPERRMSTIGHLEELRKRVWIAILSVLVGMGISFSWADQLIEWLKLPAGEALPELVFLSPAEALMAHFKMAGVAGVALAMPVLLYQLWAFIRPGFSDRENRYAFHFILWGSLCFAGGLAFAYWALLPISLKFLLNFGTESLRPLISISHYLGFTAGILLACGLVFEMPLAVFLLTKMGVLTPQRLLKSWRMAVLGMAVAASILTPTPDIINMLLLFVPLLVLYELSVFVSWLALPRGKN